MISMRVLDTAALLYWPVTELNGGICSTSQQSELEQVSLQRYMLISSLDIDWRVPTPNWIDEAKQQAASSGDLSKRIRGAQYTDHEDYTVGS